MVAGGVGERFAFSTSWIGCATKLSRSRQSGFGGLGGRRIIFGLGPAAEGDLEGVAFVSASSELGSPPLLVAE